MKSPEALTKEDWEKMMSLPEVIDAWELDETETVQAFSKRVYAAKFVHPTFFPQDTHGLYILSDGTSDGISVMVHRNGDTFFVDQ